MTETKDIETKKDISVRDKVAMTQNGFEPRTMAEAWRFAEALAQSTMVPERYIGKPRDCLIVLDLAKRLKASWLAVMQHVYSVYGIVGMEAVLVIGLVNQSRMFVDPLEYEVEGTDAKKPDYRVRAFATRISTGTVLYGPWIDWELIKGEGWYDKKGSKWKTMPEQMFHYRAASWFQRRHCPEVTMGMLTTDDIEDMPRKRVDSRTFDQAQKEEMEKIQKEAGSEAVEPGLGENDKPDAETQAKADKEKAKLRAAEKKAKAKAAKEKTKASARDKDRPPKYNCGGCHKDFDVPILKNGGELQCPKCFSLNVRLNEPEIDPDIAEENN